MCVAVVGGSAPAVQSKNVLSGLMYLARVDFCVNGCVCVFSTKMQPFSVRNCASVS